jgi:molybdopterin-guanine dinucleotide biosynthesis protein A
MRQPVCGLFVGGQARRMGGVAKGLLPAPDTGEPLVARLRRHAESLGLGCVLVGESPAYGGLGLPMLADAPSGIGPLGGLRALLLWAAGAPVVALAGDLPYVSPELLRRLLAAGSAPAPVRDVVAARRQDRWEPLCARYEATVLPVLDAALAAGEHSFQALLRRLRVHELALTADEARQLTDWDAPGDIPS